MRRILRDMAAVEGASSGSRAATGSDRFVGRRINDEGSNANAVKYEERLGHSDASESSSGMGQADDVVAAVSQLPLSCPTAEQGADYTTSETSMLLLHRVQSPVMDNEAWSILFDLYGTVIHGWLVWYGVQDCDASDLMQEIFRRIHLSISRFERRRDGSFRSWIWTITRNELIRFAESRGVKPGEGAGGSDAFSLLNQLPDAKSPDLLNDSLFVEGLLDDAHAEPDPVSTAAEVLNNALVILRPDFSPDTWDAFWRMTVLSQDPQSIAELQGTTANTVRQRKFRVFTRLKLLLRGMEVFPDSDDLSIL